MIKRGEYAIDQLAPGKRALVIEEMIQGKPIRHVAKLAQVSHGAVMNYKRDVLRPVMTTLGEQAAREMGASPFRERLESVWKRIERAMDKAEKSVVEHVSDDGSVTYEDTSLRSLPPIINCAHKSLELLGKASGELADANAASSVTATLVQVLQIPRISTETALESLESSAPTLALPSAVSVDPAPGAMRQRRTSAPRTTRTAKYY